jgi:hypothetical protein
MIPYERNDNKSKEEEEEEITTTTAITTTTTFCFQLHFLGGWVGSAVWVCCGSDV